MTRILQNKIGNAAAKLFCDYILSFQKLLAGSYHKTYRSSNYIDFQPKNS